MPPGTRCAGAKAGTCSAPISPPDDPALIWRCYMQLCHAEEAFRTLKGVFGLRPIYHHEPERIEAHLFVAILAYYYFRSPCAKNCEAWRPALSRAWCWRNSPPCKCSMSPCPPPVAASCSWCAAPNPAAMSHYSLGDWVSRTAATSATNPPALNGVVVATFCLVERAINHLGLQYPPVAEVGLTSAATKRSGLFLWADDRGICETPQSRSS